MRPTEERTGHDPASDFIRIIVAKKFGFDIVAQNQLGAALLQRAINSKITVR
jgi:hypothetical protein